METTKDFFLQLIDQNKQNLKTEPQISDFTSVGKNTKVGIVPQYG